jgi:hypothetical protein
MPLFYAPKSIRTTCGCQLIDTLAELLEYYFMEVAEHKRLHMAKLGVQEGVNEGTNLGQD